MKKLLSITMIAGLMIACNPKIVRDAIDCSYDLCSELAQGSLYIEQLDMKTVYYTDSICILHFMLKESAYRTVDYVEYLYFVDYDGKAYETLIQLSEEDSIYLTEEQMDKIKPYTFCADLNYNDAMRQRVITKLNKNGYMVGDRSANFHIEPIINTGAWELRRYKNEFGEYTGEKYILLRGNGSYTGYLSKGDKLDAILFVDKTNVSLRLIEYLLYGDGNVVCNEYTDYDMYFDVKIKDKNGRVRQFKLANNKSGDMYLTNNRVYGQEYKDIKGMLAEEGVIKCSGDMYTGYKGSYHSGSYNFSFNLSGFNEAIKFLYSKEEIAEMNLEDNLGSCSICVSLGKDSVAQQCICQRIANQYDGLYTDEQIMSKAFYSVFKKRQDSDDSELGWPEWDYWECTQGAYAKLSSVEVEVIAETTAIAHVLLYYPENGGSKQVDMPMVYENEDWFVDDIISYDNDTRYSLKEAATR